MICTQLHRAPQVRAPDRCDSEPDCSGRLVLRSRLVESLQVGLGRAGGSPAGQRDGQGRGLHGDDEGYAGRPFAQRPEGSGEDSGGDAADEAAEGGSADVEAHDEGDAVRRPIFASGSAKAGLGWERPLRQSVTTSSRPNSQHTRVGSENVRIRTSSHHL